MSAEKGKGTYLKNTLTFQTRLKIYDVMKDHISTVGEGIAVWEDGWSDTKVIQLLAAEGITITAGNVASLRKEMFGEVRTRVKVPTLKLQDHEERIQLLESEVDNLRKLINTKLVRATA